MNWQKVRAKYAAEGRASEQSDEDMIARHMLSALGISNPAKNIYDAERALLGSTADSDQPFISRAMRLAAYILGNGTNVRRVFDGRVPVLSCDRPMTHNAAIAAVEDEIVDRTDPIVHLSRTGDRACTAVYPVSTQRLDALDTPFVVMTYYGDKRDMACVSQPLPSFFKQLGPYELPGQ